jgi:hypothetical protein
MCSTRRTTGVSSRVQCIHHSRQCSGAGSPLGRRLHLCSADRRCSLSCTRATTYASSPFFHALKVQNCSCVLLRSEQAAADRKSCTGSKTWRVYGSLPGCELPSASSGDIARDALPEPVLEVTLKVGDVLFIPRGHVHEAVAHGEGSAHVTVSAYQQWTWMQMATSVLKACNVRSRFQL